MSKFFSLTSGRKPVAVPLGDKEVTEYHYEVDKDTGERKLVENELKFNWYQKIQEARVGTSMQEILSRYANGDDSVIGKIEKSYQDFTSAPRTLAEAYQMISNAERDFKTLPSDVKELFNNDVQQFMSSIGDGTLIDKLSKLSRTVDKDGKIEAEKKENLEVLYEQK